MFLLWFMYFFCSLSYISSRIFDNVISKWTFCVPQFSSGQKLQSPNLQSSYSKNEAFLSLSSLFLFLFLFLFLLSFSFVTMILELLGLKKPACEKSWKQLPSLSVIAAKFSSPSSVWNQNFNCAARRVAHKQTYFLCTWAWDHLKTSNVSSVNFKKYSTSMGRYLSPRYGQVIMVSGYPVLTAVNWSQHGCALSSCIWAPKLARKCLKRLVCLWCERMDGRADERAVTWLPKFFGWVDYHIFLGVELCYQLNKIIRRF